MYALIFSNGWWTHIDGIRLVFSLHDSVHTSDRHADYTTYFLRL